MEVLQTKDIDAVEVRRDTFAMKRIDAAHLAKEVLRCVRVKLIQRERLLTREQIEIAFMHFNHQRILPSADRTIAGRQLGKVAANFVADRAAVTAP